jgi:hypothetical protein
MGMGNLQRKFAHLDNAVPRRRRSISGCDGPRIPLRKPVGRTARIGSPENHRPRSGLLAVVGFLHRIFSLHFFHRTGTKHD